MTAPTVDTPQGDERIVVLCEKGCRYLGFTSGAVNQCPYCELSKSADTLLVALTRAQDAESALLAARREVERYRALKLALGVDCRVTAYGNPPSTVTDLDAFTDALLTERER